MKKKYIALLLITGVAIAVLLFLKKTDSAENVNESLNQTVLTDDHEHTDETVLAKNNKFSDNTMPNNDEASDEKFSQEELTEEIVNPQFDRNLFFTSDEASEDLVSLKIRWHSSCSSLKKSQIDLTDLHELMDNSHLEKPELFPTGFVQDWNLYLSKEKNFLQLSASWQADHPPSYKITLVGSDNMEFTENVSPVYMENFPQDALSWKEAEESLKQIIVRLKSEDFLVGKRTTIVSNSSKDSTEDDGTARVEYFGSTVRILQGENVLCVPSSGYLCYCQ